MLANDIYTEELKFYDCYVEESYFYQKLLHDDFLYPRKQKLSGIWNHHVCLSVCANVHAVFMKEHWKILFDTKIVYCLGVCYEFNPLSFGQV